MQFRDNKSLFFTDRTPFAQCAFWMIFVLSQLRDCAVNCRVDADRSPFLCTQTTCRHCDSTGNLGKTHS